MNRLNCNVAKQVLRQTLKKNKSILNELALAQFRGQSEGATISLDPRSKATFKTNQAVGSFYGKLIVDREECHREIFEFEDLGQFNSEILKLYPGLSCVNEFPLLSANINNQVIQWMRFFEEAGITYDIKQSTISELHFYGSYVLFYLPDVRSYSINECAGGVYIAIMSADIPIAGYSAYLDLIDVLRAKNIFIGFAIPNVVSEFSIGCQNWLEGNFVVAETDCEFFVTDKYFLSFNFGSQAEGTHVCHNSRLRLPVSAMNSSRN